MSNKKHSCKFCEESNPIKFYKGRKNICKSCLIDQESLRWKNNFLFVKDKVKNRYIKNILKYRLTSAKARAIRNNLLFDLTSEQVDALLKKQENKCVYTGEVFDNTSPVYSVSIDRIDNSKGYTINNIQLVCSSVNYMKNDLQEKEFLSLVKKIHLLKNT